MENGNLDKTDTYTRFLMNDNKVVAIIGNGFDLNLGLKTDYTSFLKSAQFNKLIAEKSTIASYLKDKQELHNWIDIENELKIYSEEVFSASRRDSFKKEYKALCAALCEYINSIDYSMMNKSSAVYKFITNIFNQQHPFVIYDFNYTESISKIMTDISIEDDNKVSLIKVHGSARNNNIILGVEDRADINKDDSFLYKSASKYYNSDINISRDLKSASLIIVIGHSLGETDHFYFEKFFSGQANPIADPQNMFFTYHGDDGWDGLMKQLMKLTIKSLAEFRSNNKISFIEI